jgi:hypothetical protein
MTASTRAVSPVAEVLGNLAQGFGRGPAPMKLTLIQGMPYLVSSMSAT